MHDSRLFRLAAAWVAAAVALSGCGPDLSPLPPGQAVVQADAARADAARLRMRMLLGFDADADAASARLADPNDDVALAAARALGRWTARRDDAASAKAVEALTAALSAERRPAVADAQAQSLMNLLTNRSGLGEGKLDMRAALDRLRTLANGRRDADFAPVGDRLSAFLARWDDPRPVRGADLFDGPGWKVTPAPPSPGPRRVAPYPQPVRTVPVVAHGAVRLGDLDGDGTLDYLVIDGSSPGLPAAYDHVGAVTVRMTLYAHDGRMVWQRPLVGDDRPLCIPDGPLPDVDGDGLAEIVYADRGGRICIRVGTGELRGRSDPLRDLDGRPLFDANVQGRPARVCLANLRGRGRRDIVVTCGRQVLALTWDFSMLWQVCLRQGGLAEPTIVADLDGDGRDELLRDGVAIGSDGRVRWTLPAAGGPLVGPLPGGRSGRLVVVATGGESVAALDGGGLLWERSKPAGAAPVMAGLFLGQSEGLRVAFQRTGPPPTPSALLLDGLGCADEGALRQGARTDAAWAPAAGDAPLVCDWDGDGRDEALLREGQAEGAAIFAWCRWPFGPAVERIALGTDVTMVGLADVDGDGRLDLLYFQGKSLVIQRRR
ncbi:MAG: hypothetical protein BIFFINMI_04304 [Phycisphaerae bacterium]|nr:hypothetical protein [Phycisphaerae bacterium]